MFVGLKGPEGTQVALLSAFKQHGSASGSPSSTSFLFVAVQLNQFQMALGCISFPCGALNLSFRIFLIMCSLLQHKDCKDPTLFKSGAKNKLRKRNFVCACQCTVKHIVILKLLCWMRCVLQQWQNLSV